MTEQEMISEILRVELLITRAIINDKHQATDDDQDYRHDASAPQA